MAKRTDFVFSNEREPHRARTKAMLQEYPQLRELIGRNPNTIFIILACVAIQVTLAIFLKDSPWWLIVASAYLLGAFADHTLFVTIHEAAHNLLFKKKAFNYLASIFANLPSIMPTAVSFKNYHLKHHSFQGIPEMDGDLPYKWEAKLINTFFLTKAIWLLLYPIFQIFRVFRLKEIKHIDGWVILNICTQVIFTAAIIYFLGIKSLVYLVISFFFSTGLHPLGGRWIQEHYLTHKEQETYSYYGPLNSINFNIGYHNEHHDFPSIPWNNLPKIRSTAPEYYNTLHYHTSWTMLFLRFLFDKEISLFSRIVRKERGKVPVTDEAMPDQETEIVM